MPMQLPETPEFDPVTVPEGGDLVRRADLIDAYQKLVNRDAWLKEHTDDEIEALLSTLNIVRSFFIGEHSGYNSTDGVVEWSPVVNNLSNFSLSGDGSVLTPPASGYYRITASGQASLGGGATAAALQIISGTSTSNLVGSQTMPAYPLIGTQARFNISQVVFIDAANGARLRVSATGGTVSSISSTTRLNVERLT